MRTCCLLQPSQQPRYATASRRLQHFFLRTVIGVQQFTVPVQQFTAQVHPLAAPLQHPPHLYTTPTITCLVLNSGCPELKAGTALLARKPPPLCIRQPAGRYSGSQGTALPQRELAGTPAQRGQARANAAVTGHCIRTLARKFLQPPARWPGCGRAECRAEAGCRGCRAGGCLCGEQAQKDCKNYRFRSLLLRRMSQQDLSSRARYPLSRTQGWRPALSVCWVVGLERGAGVCACFRVRAQRPVRGLDGGIGAGMVGVRCGRVAGVFWRVLAG